MAYLTRADKAAGAAAAKRQQQQQQQQQTQQQSQQQEAENSSTGRRNVEAEDQPTEGVAVAVSTAPVAGTTAAAAAMASPHLEGNGRGDLKVVGDITMTRNVEILKG